MVTDEHIEELRQKVLRAGRIADDLLESAVLAERLWHKAKLDYNSAHRLYGRALEQRQAEVR